MSTDICIQVPTCNVIIQNTYIIISIKNMRNDCGIEIYDAQKWLWDNFKVLSITP